MLGWLFSDPLPVGSKALEFSLPDDSGAIRTLTSLRGKPATEEVLAAAK
jgi:hypothetical protein